METRQTRATSSCRPKLSQNNNGAVPIHYATFKQNPKTRTHRTETRHTQAKRSCWKQFSPISTKLSQNNNGGVPIHYPNFKWNLKTRAHEMETRHDTTGLKVHAEDNFLRCQRNSPQTTMVVSPSITQIWAKSETRTHKTAARNTFAKSSCWKQFSLISTKLSQNNNGGVPIYYPNFKWNLKTRAHEMETRHNGAKSSCRKQFSSNSTKLS